LEKLDNWYMTPMDIAKFSMNQEIIDLFAVSVSTRGTRERRGRHQRKAGGRRGRPEEGPREARGRSEEGLRKPQEGPRKA
jgi:hypothetical protein